MAGMLEEKLSEAACLGDTKTVTTLLASDSINVNSQNNLNGWTALHWACKRGHEDIVRMLINNGADRNLENFNGEKPADVCHSKSICELLGVSSAPLVPSQLKESNLPFVPSYLRNASPLVNSQVADVNRSQRSKHSDFSIMPTTSLPATTQNDELVLKVKIQGSSDPDYIEIDIPKWKLTYNNLLKICCEELDVPQQHVERIRKLPNTRLRNDNDVKRLRDYQALELVLRNPNNDNKVNNCYQSISSKDQTILY